MSASRCRSYGGFVKRRCARLPAADETARARLEKLATEFLQPMLHLPRHPIALARFGIPGLCPSTLLAKSLFKREPARALFTGIAAHSFFPLEAPVSSAFALVLGTAGHAVVWPIPSGG